MHQMIFLSLFIALFGAATTLFSSRVVAAVPIQKTAESCHDFPITQQGTHYYHTLAQSKSFERNQAALTYLRLVQNTFARSPLEKKQRVADILNDIIAYSDAENHDLETGCTEAGTHIDDEEIIGGRAVVTGRVVVETVPERFCYPDCESEMVQSVKLVDLERSNTDWPERLGLGCQEGDAIIGTVVNDLSAPYDKTNRPLRELWIEASDEKKSYAVFILPHLRSATAVHPCATQVLSIQPL